MDTEFISLHINRTEALELHAALVERAMVEDELRREKGLEPVACQPLLEKLDVLLGLSDPQAEALAQALDDELWEHAWYVFTDEWAWFRAKQDVERDIGPDRAKLDDAELRRRIELRYQKDFARFVKEVEMKDARKIA